MPPSERIVVEPKILAGKPVIRGTRLAVEFILELLAAGQSENDVLANYPGLTREDILASVCRTPANSPTNTRRSRFQRSCGCSPMRTFRIHPATPENLAPLVRALGEADTTWAGHISIITVDGIQMVTARRG